MSAIAYSGSFAMIVPLLRDPELSVRSVVPRALQITGGAEGAVSAITEAIHAGFSSREAVEALVRFASPELDSTLIEIITRWDPTASRSSGDSASAVIAALVALMDAPRFNAALVPAVRGLLARKPDAVVTAAAAQLIGKRRNFGDAGAPEGVAALLPLVAHVDGTVRTQAGWALEQFGDPIGRQTIELIQQCRPQGGPLQWLQAILRGGPDAGQAASAAVQQVTQWFSKVSRETVERVATGASTAPPSAAAMNDARLPWLVRTMLANALDTLRHSMSPDETQELAFLAASSLRALARIGPPASLAAREEILRALHAVTASVLPERPGTGGTPAGQPQDVGALIRAAAADTLVQLYANASFALLLEAVFALETTARGTAVTALGRLGDTRAVPILQGIAAGPDAGLAAAAQESLAAIRKTNPEMMTLLRASSAVGTRADTLLRPASGATSAPPETLLRPTQRPGPPQPENPPQRAPAES
jgi:hypothetical protein